jgi:HK97 family phage portal protein
MKLFGIEIKKNSNKTDEDLNEPKIRQVYLPQFTYQNQVPIPSDMMPLVNAYRSWVYICASKNSNSIAATPIRLYAKKTRKNQKFIVKTKDVPPLVVKRFMQNSSLTKTLSNALEVKEVLEHPFLDLIQHVNPLANRFDLWDMTQLFMELTGNAYWYIVKDSQMGIPVQIWVIPSQYMQIVTSKDQMVAGYVFRYGTRLVPFEFDEIAHFKFSSPLSQLYGTGPLAAILDTYNVDQSIRGYESSMLNSGGRPDGVLQTDQGLNDKEFERLKEQWNQRYGGASKAGKTLILEKGLTYEAISFTPKEMNYVTGRKLNREEIAAAFGVPMSKLTSETVNLANAYAGEKQYAQDTLEPRLRRLEEKINERVLPMYEDGDNLFVAYDSAVPEDKEFESVERQRRLSAYITTVNEEREKLGMQPVDWGDMPLTNPGVGPLGSQQGMPEDQVGMIPTSKPENLDTGDNLKPGQQVPRKATYLYMYN